MATVAAGALVASLVAANTFAAPPLLPTAILGLSGILLLLTSLWRRHWEVPLQLTAALLLGAVAWWTEHRLWWVSALASLTILGTFWASLVRAQRRIKDAESKADQLAVQVDRRISELFSLQELSYVLSESIQLDRVVDQVARYAARFLQADGAVVVLAEDEGRVLRVVAASGSLEPLRGNASQESESALVRFAISRDRIEVAQGVDTPTVDLIGGLMVRSAAVAPLRAQGIMMGALAVADRRGGPFTTEDLWLLSTVATNASVVLANSRLYEMVRRSEEDWETAFNALTEGLAVVGPRCAILRANSALASIAELPEEHLIGLDFTKLFPGASDAVATLIDAVYRREKTAPLVVHLDQRQRVFRLTAAPLAGAESGSAVILIEDETEQRLLEAQIIQNDKMASIGQLVSGVAHELNNPLTSITGLAELLLERPPHPELPRDHLRVIHDQAERAGRIVRNLLTFARKGVAEKSAVDLNDVVTRTSLLIVYELQLHEIELESQLSSEPVVVLGDRYELQQVLLNLVTNAVQAVSGLPPEKERRIILWTGRFEDEAILRVQDSGPGVPKHHAPYLFTPFFTTKAAGEGTGLGLSLSYGLVKAHGGTLSYEPVPEGGAEFRISLPWYPADAEFIADPKASTNGVAAGRRILVVDEDPAVHRLISAVFTPDGHAVESARSGEQALRLARDGEWDLIIADMRMATGASQPLTRVLLDLRPEIRERLVLACSGEEEVRTHAGEEKLRRVRKPFNPRDLRTVAKEIFQ